MQDVDTNILALDGGGSSSCRDFCLEHVEQCSSCTENGNLPTYESSLRKSYCVFMQKLGRQLKLPQVTIATAIIFCHRFFLRQSLARNDRYIIATVCVFLAGKVEETPEGLQNVIVASYELRNAKDPDAMSKIKQKEVYDEQKELLLLGERLVLNTLGFNLNVAHPYKPLISAIKRLSLPPTVSRSQLAQIAWNFVNDGLQTLLCVQFKPYHVAAGALFLTAKFLRIKIFDWEEILSREFDMSLQQLEDVSNQILQSYEPLRDVSANGSRGSKLIRVHAATSCRNQASTDSPVDLNMISPLSIHEGDAKLPSSPGRATMDEETRTRMLQKTQETKAASCDLESGTCHTGQSDLTDENETRVLGGSYYPEEDYLESEKDRSCEEFDKSCGSLTPIGSDDHSTYRPCLSGWEMESRRDDRDTSPDIETKDGAVVEVRRHNPCDRVSSRHRDIRQVFNRSLFDRRRDPRKAVTRREVRNKFTPARRDLTDFKNRHLQNRLKLLRQKDEILKTHYSWGTKEHNVKYSG